MAPSPSFDSGVAVKEFIDIAVSKTGIEGLLEVYVEDAEEPLHHDLALIEHLSIEFAPLQNAIA